MEAYCFKAPSQKDLETCILHLFVYGIPPAKGYSYLRWFNMIDIRCSSMQIKWTLIIPDIVDIWYLSCQSEPHIFFLLCFAPKIAWAQKHFLTPHGGGDDQRSG